MTDVPLPPFCADCVFVHPGAYFARQVESSGCVVHVGCDVACQALVDPVTPDEVRAAWTHWKDHEFLGGCSHAE